MDEKKKMKIYESREGVLGIVIGGSMKNNGMEKVIHQIIIID